MNIKFQGHQQTQREVELSQQELFQLFEMMRQEFKDHITYCKFSGTYPSQAEKEIIDFCNSFSVDCEYQKDRVSFFNSILSEMKNPYQ